MDYRDAVIAATNLSGQQPSVVAVADAIFAAYEAGKADPPEPEPRRCEPAHNIDHVSMDDVAEFCRVTGRVLVAKEEWQEFSAWKALPSRGTLNGLMADKRRMDYMASLADGRIYSATFSRSNICLTLRDGYESTFRQCVDNAIEEASK